MSLELGLVGLPNVGKSTLFNALTRAGAAVASYPFTTIEPNVGIVPLRDGRLEWLGSMVQPERLVPTTLRVVDIAGLVRGASKGEGLGNQFLSHIRTVDAVAMVVRCFQSESVPHVTETLDPVADIDVVELELMLADLEIVHRQIERVRASAKANPRIFGEQIVTLEQVAASLEAGSPLRALEWSPEQRDALAGLDLLTDKPRLYVANVGEESLPEGGALAQRVRERAASEGAETIVLSAQLEAELLDLELAEANDYRAALGLESAGLDRLVNAGYRLLNLLSFFTVTGGKEVRAWTLRSGQTIYEAAGRIHSDMQRGFIRAEVIAFDDLREFGSMARAREAGRIAVEGRDYVVHDGDVIHVRFAV